MTKMHILDSYIRQFALALVFLSGVSARAGTLVTDAKDSKAVTPAPADNGWKFDLATPSWLAATSGTIGLGGINSHIYMGADTLLKHLDMTGALSVEARKGPFGIYGDFLYVKVSDAVYPNGLIGKADLHLDQWLADLELSYRVLEGPKGYLDLRAGVRYTSIYNSIITNANNSAINAASEQLVDGVADAVKKRLNELDLKGRLQSVLEERIKADALTKLSGLEANRPALAIAPLLGDRRPRLDKLVRSDIDARFNELAAALRARETAATDELRAAAQARVNSLKQKLTDQIASTLRSKLQTSASLEEQWLDPYVGFAFRYNLSKALYLKGKADIGGFGLGSEITWQAYGALGCQVSRYIYAEAGYRYLYTDYNQGDFLYDVTQSGAQITLGIAF